MIGSYTCLLTPQVKRCLIKAKVFHLFSANNLNQGNLTYSVLVPYLGSFLEMVDSASFPYSSLPSDDDVVSQSVVQSGRARSEMAKLLDLHHSEMGAGALNSELGTIHRGRPQGGGQGVKTYPIF